MFAEFGSITEANVVYDRETGRSRGFGFVAFSEEASASDAIKAMDQAEIGGRTINVKYAKQREARPRRD
ncbi:MAG: RNA recognition motif domain-containing protein [Promethearchaeia archaeon]